MWPSAWAPAVPALIGLSNVLRGASRARATGLAAVAGGLAEMFAVCGIGAILDRPRNSDFSYCVGHSRQRLDAKLAFRPVDMLERINAPFRWPLPVVDVVSEPSHVLNHYSWTHFRPPSLYWYP